MSKSKLSWLFLALGLVIIVASLALFNAILFFIGLLIIAFGTYLEAKHEREKEKKERTPQDNDNYFMQTHSECDH